MCKIFLHFFSLNPCRAQLLIVNTLNAQKYNYFKYPPIYTNINTINVTLSHTSHKSPIKIMLRKLLTPNIQRIKSISAIGAMLQQVLLRFGIFLCGLVLAKAVSSAFHASRLHRKNKVIIVLAIEIRHEPLLASEALVDEQILTIVGLCFD